jgi:hypothetical protein
MSAPESDTVPTTVSVSDEDDTIDDCLRIHLDKSCRLYDSHYRVTESPRTGRLHVSLH